MSRHHQVVLKWLLNQLDIITHNHEILIPYSSISFLLLLLHFFLFFFILILSIYKLTKTTKPKSQKYLLPPSPSKLPIIGNLHQLGSSPHRALKSLSQKYGPLMLLHLGQVPTLVVSSASMAEEIMKTHDLVCSSRPKLSIPNKLLYNKDIAFAPYGEYWRQGRKICVLQLLSVKKVQSFKSVREEEVTLMIEKIRNVHDLGLLVDLTKRLVSLTNGIICRVALGRKYYSDDERGKRVKEMIEEFVELLGVFDVGGLIPWLSWMNYVSGLDARVERNFREIDEFLDGVIEDHIEKNEKKKREFCDGDEQKEGDEDEDEDFVDVLLRIGKEEAIGIPFARDNIKAIIMDMFSAGTDTTYTVLEWTMAELLRNPKVMKQVQNEVREITRGKSIVTEEDIQQMHYLKAVIKETLRLHPPLPLLVLRESTEDFKINGYDVHAKTRIIVNVFAIGRDPISWEEEPEEFRPERFLNDGSTSIDYKGQDFQLIPFGAGRRGCPGIHLAMSTIELALASLLKEFIWELPNGCQDVDMVEGSGITIHKKFPLLLVAKPHQSSYM